MSLPAARRDTGVPSQVLMTNHITITVLAQELSDSYGLVPAMLEQQPAAGPEKFPRMQRDMADGIKPIGAGDERSCRLEAHVALF